MRTARAIERRGSSVTFGKRMKALLTSFVALLLSTAAVADVAVLPAIYGQRVRYQASLLEYPAFSMHFVQREEWSLPGTRLRGMHYLFDVVGSRDGKRICGVKFTTSGVMENGQSFVVGGRTYVAEMFYTTAGMPEPPVAPPTTNPVISEDEIIVWDEESASTGNLPILGAWKTKKPNQSLEPTSTAGTSAAEQPLVPAAVVAHL